MHRDFKELLSAFNEGHVKYLVVGGYAVSMHAVHALKIVHTTPEWRSRNDVVTFAPLIGSETRHGRAMPHCDF
jgi:hypothetical protein